MTVAGERSRWFGQEATTDGSLSSVTRNLSSDLYLKGLRESGTVNRLLATPAPAPIRSRRGRRRRKSAKPHADEGCDYAHLRRWLR